MESFLVPYQVYLGKEPTHCRVMSTWIMKKSQSRLDQFQTYLRNQGEYSSSENLSMEDFRLGLGELG